MNNFWKDKKVLITGISGFVGSRLALRLVENGASVIGITRCLTKVPDVVRDSCKVYTGDICDYETVKSIISYEEIKVLYHFAANAIVRTSANDPLGTYKVNVMGTANVLEAARIIGGLESIVVASSDKAYGDHKELPYKDTYPLQPKNTYDTSKACMDMLARSYAHNYDMPIIVTRCSNIYGPGDMNVSRLIPNTIRRALDNEPAMLYSDVSKMLREFIYIDDVVDAYELLGETLNTCLEVRLLKSVNIGGNGPESIRHVVDLTRELCGSELEPVIVERDPRFKEIKEQYIDARRMKKLLGWETEVSLVTGLALTVAWYRKFYRDGEYS